jgi:integrase/recombinase XerD
MSNAELKDSFLLALKAERNLSAHTVRAYANDIQAFLIWLEYEELPLCQADHKTLRHYLGHLNRLHYARSTINRHLSAIRCFSSWLVEHGHAERDVSQVVSGQKPAKLLPRLVAHEDLELALGDGRAGTEQVQYEESLAAALAPLQADSTANASSPGPADPADFRDRLLVELLYASGARISEIAALKVQDISMAQSQLRLFGKGAKERIVPLYPLALQCLDTYLLSFRPQLLAMAKQPVATDAVFISTRGRAMSADSLRAAFKAFFRRRGVTTPVTPHTMRHTFATDLLNNGADIRGVQELLGHASLTSTQIYTHLSISRLKEAHSRAHPRSSAEAE